MIEQGHYKHTLCNATKCVETHSNSKVASRRLETLLSLHPPYFCMYVRSGFFPPGVIAGSRLLRQV